MDKLNVEYLKRNLKYLGFGNALDKILEAKMTEGEEKFTIGVTSQFENAGSIKNKDFPKDSVHYELRFSKSSKTDNYFLNSYKATLERGTSDPKKADAISQIFQLNKGNDVTAKEAYNLLSGRSILKTVEITSKYDLHFINEQGVLVSESKVSSIQEAKDAISKLNEKNETKGGYFEIVDKGYPVRVYDMDEKDLTSEPSGKVVLLHEYHHPSEKANHKAHYTMENIAEATNTINKLVEEKNPEHETRGFGIYDETGKILLFNFDKNGVEVDISPEKRKEKIWIKLDLEDQNERGGYKFKKFYPNYGFDLARELEKFPILELKDQKQKERLIGSISRGNLQAVNFEKDGQKELFYIEADPQFKRLNVYDRDLKEVYQSKGENIHSHKEEGPQILRSRYNKNSQ